MCVSSIGVSGIFPSPTLLKHLASLLKIVQIQEQKVTDCALNKLHGIERIMGFLKKILLFNYSCLHFLRNRFFRRFSFALSPLVCPCF